MLLLLLNTSPPPRPLTDFFSFGAVNNKEKQKQKNKELTNFNERRRAPVAEGTLPLVYPSHQEPLGFL